jgi:hypothetical protein
MSESEIEITISNNEPTNETALAKRNCGLLKKIVKARELAHIDVRGWKKQYDSGLKVAAMIASTATTYTINSQGEDITDTTLLIERMLSFSTTILTGLAAMLDNGTKAELHNDYVTKYADLANKIEESLLNGCTLNNFHDFCKEYRDIKKEAPPLSGWVVKRHPYARKGMETEK